MIGLGLVSYGRQDYRAQAIEAIYAHLDGALDAFLVIEDVCPVAKAKNMAVSALLDMGCDWLFLSEDDVIVQSPLAITGYIEAAEASGLGHLAFHAHGPANPAPTGVDQSGKVTYWPNSVGAFCLYSAESLSLGGPMDETFHNAFEHVEHSQRLAALGFTTLWPNNADATGSEDWLTEIPGSIKNTSIPHSERGENTRAAREHWLATYPETYHRIFG